MSKTLIRHASVNSKTSLKVFGSWPAFVSLQLASCEMVNHNTKRLRFKLPNEDAISGLPLTSGVLTISWPNGRWLPVARPYTPISALGAALSKDYHGSNLTSDDTRSTRVPRATREALSPGQTKHTLTFARAGTVACLCGAVAGLSLEAQQLPACVTMLAGGLGITPIYQLARSILSNPEDKTAITLLFAANTEQDLVLKDELDRLQSEFASRLTVTYIVSHSAIDSKSLFQKGRVTRDLLHKVAPRPKDQDTKVFICGPPAMESALIGTKEKTGILEELGYVKDQVHKF